MAEYPALPLFTDAYMADTRHLTAAQHGAYLLLLMTAWRMPDCRLPDDDKFLARCASMDNRAWKINRDVIMAFWKQDDQQKWYQGRLDDERKYVDDLRNKNSAAGRASALKRKNRHSTTVPTKTQPNFNPHTHTLPIIKESKNRGTRFALAQCPLEWIEICKELRPDLDAVKIFDGFRDYWIGVAGAKGIKLDWDATWRNWLRNQSGSLKITSNKPLTTTEIDRQARKGAKTIL